MSGSGSDGGEGVPFVESDNAATRMDYDKGGVPLYVAIVWVLFLASYVIYMVVFGLPDLQAWGALTR